jgi:hypothetical protein
LAELEELADRERGLNVVVWVGVLGLGETAGNDLAHGAQGNVNARWGSSSCSTGAGGWLVVLDVGFGNATSCTGTLNILQRNSLLKSISLSKRRCIDTAFLTLKDSAKLALKVLWLFGGRRGRCGLLLRFRSLRLLLFLRRSRLRLATGIGKSEIGERRDILTLLNDNSNWLHKTVS